MTSVVAVHCGAGRHSNKNYHSYNVLSKKACRKGIQVLKSGGTALEAVKQSVIVLENHPLTNAGFGSNLTRDGEVEMDAAVMDGKTLHYGGCGAVKRLKNPIALAYEICINQQSSQPYGLVPPNLLVGEGAYQFARQKRLKIAKSFDLVSSKASKQYKKYRTLLETKVESNSLDTVGAVCVDNDGHVAAATSSGGILLKHSGRVGQAALYGSGLWADSFNIASEPAIAVSTTGCGEYLVKTQLSKQIADDLKHATSTIIGLHNCLDKKFLKSKFLNGESLKLGGALVLHFDEKSSETSILWGHSTETMSLGYMASDSKPKAIISELPTGTQEGMKIVIGGDYFYTN